MKYGQWIPVTERLPEDGQECIIFDNVYGGLCGTFDKRATIWETNENGYWQHDAGKDVTHWMPLPEPPSDKEEAGVLQTIYDTPETCPNCMEHLSLDWAYCPECGRPTDWNKNKKSYDCIEGMCCDCTHGNGKCCDYSENTDCEYHKEDGSCWEEYK